jgi:hypothetical protein
LVPIVEPGTLFMLAATGVIVVAMGTLFVFTR